MVALLPQFIGRYELIEHLASGGMGHVYLARTRGVGGFERRVVIKALEPHEDDADMIAMFLDEARLLGALHHQYIVPVHEVNCDEDGRFYFVMDYLPGETAAVIYRRCVERARTVPLELVLGLGSAVATALAYAHDARGPDGAPREIVHRDVSPSNIIVGHDGSVRLIDFGIAKAAQRATKTQAGAMKGKLGYVAPEQILHTPIDRRTDVFALGVVLYELTTGTRAFQDASDLITFERILRGELAPPSEVVRNYPQDLERIVMKAISVAPVDRYQDAGLLADDLEAFADQHQIPHGHAAIAHAMTELFGANVVRHRSPRLGSESDHDAGSTDLGIPIHIKCEVTPITAIIAEIDEGARTRESDPITSPH